MFQRLIRCPISFFDLNPVGMLYICRSHVNIFILFIEGRILNRFTKDVAIIDEQLPPTLFDLFHVCLKYLARAYEYGLLVHSFSVAL
jgi:ABC-type multidrug transport system fused ATPase/permease subunit